MLLCLPLLVNAVSEWIPPPGAHPAGGQKAPTLSAPRGGGSDPVASTTIDRLFSGDLRVDIPLLRATLDQMYTEDVAERGGGGGPAAGRANKADVQDIADWGVGDGEEAGGGGGGGGARRRQERVEWQLAPPFPPPPVVVVASGGRGGAGQQAGQPLARLLPLPFQPPRPEPRQCCPLFRR